MKKSTILIFLSILQISNLEGQNGIDIKVDSLFNTHILSLKSGLNDTTIKNQVKVNDVCFLDMFYFLSGLQIGKEQHSYGRYPRYIQNSDIAILEDWYRVYKAKISYERIERIYCLIDKMRKTKEQKQDIDSLLIKFKKLIWS